MPDIWTPSDLRAYVRGHWALGGPGTLAWIANQHEAGMTVALYECPVLDRTGIRHAMLLPAECGTLPPAELPFTDGRAAWPMHLVAVCRPPGDGIAPVVPIGAARVRR